MPACVDERAPFTRAAFACRSSSAGRPAGSPAVAKSTPPCAHIDMVPTLLQRLRHLPCRKIARSTASICCRCWKRRSRRPDRTLFFQWHRGDVPEKYRAFAARGPQFKLVQAAGVQPNAKFEPKFELFDIDADPFEQHDLAAQKPDIVAKMKAEYERWFADVTQAGFAPVRPQLGTPHENPTRLTRQDWRGPKAADWEGNGLGHWEVNIPTAGTFDVTVTLKGVKDGSTVHFRLGEVIVEGAGVAARAAPIYISRPEAAGR